MYNFLIGRRYNYVYSLSNGICANCHILMVYSLENFLTFSVLLHTILN